MIPPYSSNRLPSSSCGSSSVDDSLEGGEQSEVTAVECYGMKAGGKRRRGFLLSGVSSWLGLLSTRGRLVTWLTIDNRKRWLDACPTCMLTWPQIEAEFQICQSTVRNEELNVPVPLIMAMPHRTNSIYTSYFPTMIDKIQVEFYSVSWLTGLDSGDASTVDDDPR